MTITEILNSERENKDKLDSVCSLVEKLRKTYGNADVVLGDEEVTTPYGLIDFSELEDSSKLIIIEKEVREIKAITLEAVKETKGLNAKIFAESLIATNRILSSINKRTDLGII